MTAATKLTREDFTSEVGYVLYCNRHRLPTGFDTDPDCEWKLDKRQWEAEVPKYIRDLVERDFYDRKLNGSTKPFGIDPQSEYVWTMFCLWERLGELGLETEQENRNTSTLDKEN